MMSSALRNALHARPFRPFLIRTVGDETFPVLGPENAWHPPDGEVVAVTGPDGVELLDVESITAVEFTPDPPGPKGQVQRLRRLILAQPFTAFVVRLADGRRIAVTRAGSVAMSPKGSAVTFAGADEDFVVLDADQIADVEPGPGAAPDGASPPGP